MKAVDFYKLPRSIQDRFVGSVTSGFPPAPILSMRGGTQKKLFWLAVSLGCFVVLLLCARLGYGSLESALSIHSKLALLLYVALVFGIVFGLVQALACVVRERALPYASGVYLFPSCAIDARSDAFHVFETKDLAAVEAQGSSVRVAFAGGRQFVFPAGSRDPQTLVQEINSARDRAMRAHAMEDPKELVAVDPLHNPRFSSPVGPREPYVVKRPPWGRLGWAVAALVGIGIGGGLWALRNAGSDTRMYAIAKSEDKASVYRAYLEHGVKYRDTVTDVDLPRAELHEAMATRTVDALLDFKRKHPSPNAQIAKEMQAAIRAGMLAELEKAKLIGTLAALNDFAKRYPDHGVEPELRAAVHSVYARELDAYKKRAPQKDKNAVAFVERLFAWAEKKGSKVEVRFRRKTPTTMDRADQYVMKSTHFVGMLTLPSRFFDEKHDVPREQALGKLLATQFDEGLSPELFDVSVGAPIPADAEGMPDVTVPTLFITHASEWSGHGLNNGKPRGVYIGLQFNFDASFVIPNDQKPYKSSLPIQKPFASVAVLKDEDPMPGPGLAEEKVYNAMATDAFERFGKHLLASFFSEKPKKE